MARMPGTDWVGPHHDNGVMSRYDVLCFHTIVGFAPAHAAHLSVRADGYLFQSRDTAFRSAANLNGNYRVLAVETEDHGAAFGTWSGSDVPAWTAQQIETNAKIAAWAHVTHGIPLVQCPDSRPTSRGVAFHRQGCDGNYSNGRVAGGELWSSSPGKVCPGDRRISQMPQIISRARQLAGLDPSTEDDMPLTVADTNAVWMQKCTMTYADGATETHPAAEWLTVMAVRISSLVGSVAGLSEAVAQLSNNADLTADEVKAIIADAVEQNLHITGTVTVTGS